MNYGLYLSAMGLQVQEYRQGVTANNMANASNAGFKRAIANVQARPNAAQTDPRMRDYRTSVYGKLGGGAWAQPTGVDLSQGTITQSSGPMDLALDGAGFFMVEGQAGAGGEKRPALLTRDGKFAFSTEGELVMATGGKRVLDADGEPIKLNTSLPVSFGPRGEVMQAGTKVATLAVMNVEDARGIEPVGGNTLRVREGFKTVPAETARVRQGYIESSGTDPMIEMVSMMEGMRVFEANARLITMQDQMLQQLNAVGRVA